MEKNPSSLSIVAVLSGSEVALGGFLHSFHIPLSGQLLSLNQCFWLNVSKSWSPTHSPSKISLQVAAIKLMTPLGKRVTPMLAIAMQGFLFEGGCKIFGDNLGGRIVGSSLMSLWSFVQPMLLYGLLLGRSLTDIFDFFSNQTGISIFAGIIFLVGIKIVAAIGVSLNAHFLAKRVQAIENYGLWLENLGQKIYKKEPKLGWKKIWRSPFLISLIFIHLYLYFTTESWEYFLRQSLFSILWTVTIFYLWDGLEKKILTQFNLNHSNN